MKQYLIKLSQAILLCIVVVFSSCENEQLEPGNSVTSISSAKNWYDGFKTKENFQPIFKNLIYSWEDASIAILTDGTEAIRIPVVYPYQSLDYYGHKIMYLYPKKKGEGFDVTLFEFIPNPKKVQVRGATIDWKAFDGYIINWDLVNGFVNGAKFEDNLSVFPINVKIKDSDQKDNNWNKVAPIIDLDEVVVFSKGSSTSSSGSYSFVFSSTYASFGSTTTSGNYANSPYGGGSRGDGNSGTYAPPSCESFDFKNKSGSLWQEAAVKNVHFKIVVISPNGYKFSQIINYPNAILFGAPTNLAIGNTDISAGLAATLSAKAVEASMSETVSMYGNKPVSELTVRLYFEERLRHNYPLFIPGGRVNFNASGFSGTPTNYQTNMFGTGNCN